MNAETNFFQVGLSSVKKASVYSENIVVLRPPKEWTMTKEQALNLAAWIVALADDSAQHDDFRRLVRRIEEL